MKDKFWWKRIFDGRHPLVKTTFMEDDFWWKTTFDGRQHLMEDTLWWKNTFDGRQLLLKATFSACKTTFKWKKQSFWTRGFHNWMFTLKTNSCQKILSLLCRSLDMWPTFVSFSILQEYLWVFSFFSVNCARKRKFPKDYRTHLVVQFLLNNSLNLHLVSGHFNP